jgi:hypothetical protein
MLSFTEMILGVSLTLIVYAGMFITILAYDRRKEKGRETHPETDCGR